MTPFILSPRILLPLLLGMFLLPEGFALPLPQPHMSSNSDVATSTNNTNGVTKLIGYNTYLNKPIIHQSNASASASASSSDIECDICIHIAKGLNTTLFNPKIVKIVTDGILKVCSVLPDSVKLVCIDAATNMAPIILAQIGEFIVTDGCIEIGVCKPSMLVANNEIYVA